MNNTVLINIKSLINSGLRQLKLPNTDFYTIKILQYLEILIKWNNHINLVSTSDPQQLLVRHILDSLSIVKFINGNNILDFGTGAGLPGVPLALFFPQFHFTLIDSANKKTIFLNHVKFLLKIDNITIVNTRIEHFVPSIQFDTVVTRATDSIQGIISKTRNLCSIKGQILSMKGKIPYKELEFLSKNAFTIHILQVPYLNEERHLIKIII